MEIRVVVASEVRLYREGLQRMLQDVAGITLVGIAACAEEVVDLACALVPTVVLLDLAMAKALTVAKNFARAPKVGGVVVLGIPEAYADVAGCLPAGVLGFVTPNGTVADLMDAIRAAARGESCCLRAAPAPVQRATGVAAGRSSGTIDGLTIR